MSTGESVTTMDLRDVVENIRLLLDSSGADVDGITASTNPHPASDPSATARGEGAMLIAFTDPEGRNRVAEVELTARWREDSCWHLRTTPGQLGDECTDCGTVTTPTQVTARCPECNSPVNDQVTYVGAHTASCTLAMCQCEHADHDHPTNTHPHLGAPAGKHRAQHVGLICDDCATGHLADYLVTGRDGVQ